MNRILKKGKAEGSVLITVVTVMMVLVFFLMSTLILTTSTNRRAFYNYYEKQAQYSAQAALDAATNTAYNDANFFQWLSAQRTTGTLLPVTIEFNNSNMPFTNKTDADVSTVNCTVEYLGESAIWDEMSGMMYNQARWKLTATAHVGQGRNEASYSVSNYLYQNPVTRDVANSANRVEYTWRVLGAEVEDTPGGPGTPPTGGGGTRSHAIYNLANSTNAVGNLNAYGPLTNNMGEAPAPGNFMTYSDANPLKTKNNGRLVTDILFNGTFQQTDEREFVFQHVGSNSNAANSEDRVWAEGLTVLGNMIYDNDQTTTIKSTIPDDELSRVKQYNELPFVYVDGKFEAGKTTIGDATRRVNLYAGTVEPSSVHQFANYTFNMNGDMFLYNPLGTSWFAMGSTNLLNFTENNVNKANYTYQGYVGGDLISNNSVVKIGFSQNAADNAGVDAWRNNATVKIGGDLIMTNPQSTLLLSGGGNVKVEVDGVVLLAGGLTLNGSVTLDAKGGIYVNPDKVNMSELQIKSPYWDGYDVFTPHLKIAGNDFTINSANTNPTFSVKVKDKTGLEHTCSNQEVFVESLNLYATGDDYVKLFDNIKTKARGLYDTEIKKYDAAYKGYEASLKDKFGTTNWEKFDYSFMPFCSRLDEIHERYVRWDLIYGGTPSADQNNIKYESEAAGHNYEHTVDVKSYATGNTTTYPYCLPLNAAKHSFIKYRSFGTSEFSSSAGYYTAIADYPNGSTVWSTGKKGIETLTKSDVTIAGHINNGDASNHGFCTETLSDAYIIKNSMVLDLTSITSARQSTTAQGASEPFSGCTNIFVDPPINGTIILILDGKMAGDHNLNIVVNNTVEYKNNQYANVAYTDAYVEQAMQPGKASTKAGRENVAIFFNDNCTYINKLTVITTGMAVQYLNGSLDVIGNPYYYDTNKDAIDKYIADKDYTSAFACELVPNVRCYAAGSDLISFTNNLFMNAELLIPNKGMKTGTSTISSNMSYREYPFSTPYSSGGKESILTIGSFVSKSVEIGDAKMCSVFIGDAYRNGGTPPADPTYKFEDPTESDSADATKDKGVGGQNYFSNQFQGAGG